MKISNPIKNFKCKYFPEGNVTQFFGESVDLYKALGVGMNNGHTGIDIVSFYGDNIYAVEGGLVCDVQDTDSGYGRYVRILSRIDNTNGREYVYGHLSGINVKLGDTVVAGQCIGYEGNSGFVVSSVSSDALGYWHHGGNNHNGTHLHLAVRNFKYDMNGWKRNPITPPITILNYDNGSLGYVDFKDMFYDSEAGNVAILKYEKENPPKALDLNNPTVWDNFLKLLRILRNL